MQKEVMRSHAKEESSATKFVIQMEQDERKIGGEPYITKLQVYAGGRRNIEFAFREVDIAIQNLIAHHLLRLSRRGRIAVSLDQLMNAIVAYFTGPAAIATSFVTAPLLQALIDRRQGKKVQIAFNGDTWAQRLKSLVSTSQTHTPLGRAVDHLLKAYRMFKFLRLHRKTVSQLKSMDDIYVSRK